MINAVVFIAHRHVQSLEAVLWTPGQHNSCNENMSLCSKFLFVSSFIPITKSLSQSFYQQIRSEKIMSWLVSKRNSFIERSSHGRFRPLSSSPRDRFCSFKWFLNLFLLVLELLTNQFINRSMRTGVKWQCYKQLYVSHNLFTRSMAVETCAPPCCPWAWMNRFCTSAGHQQKWLKEK